MLKNILNWILNARKPASVILTLLIEIVLELLEERFIILDYNRTKKLIKADLAALLYEIAVGERKTVTFSFFINRIKRITLNLHQAGLLATKYYFSEIESKKTENHEFLDYLLGEYGQSPEYIIIRPKKKNEKKKDENSRKNESRQYLKRKTYKKLYILSEIDEFFPGCLEVERREYEQQSLFNFVKKEKIIIKNAKKAV